MALPVRLVVPALFLALASVAGAQSQSQPDLRGFAILGFDQVRLGPNVRVPRGAVGANVLPPGESGFIQHLPDGSGLADPTWATRPSCSAPTPTKPMLLR